MSDTSSVRLSGRAAGARQRASQLGHWLVGELVVAAFIATAAAPMAEAATRLLYLEGPRAAAPPGWLGTGAADPAGNPVVVASSRAAVAGDYHISAAPAAGADATAVTGGEVIWYAVAHIAGVAAVFLARAGTGAALIIITVVRAARSGAGGRGAGGRQVVTWR